MRTLRVQWNPATLAGWALLAIGGAILLLDERMGMSPETGFKLGGGILVLALLVYLAGRIAMLIRGPRR